MKRILIVLGLLLLLEILIGKVVYSDSLFSQANKGDAHAQFLIGQCYYEGDVADRKYKKASKVANSVSQELGLPLISTNSHLGKGVKRNYKKAIKYFRMAAKQGNVQAQFYLGFCYRDGQGVSIDFKESFMWFESAAKQSYAPAQDELGNCYYLGRGILQDYSKAIKLYRLAAEQGSVAAQINLAYCYDGGLGINQDKSEAVKLYRLAAEHEDHNSKDFLWCRFDSNEGIWESFNRLAQLRMGECYYNGNGVVSDKAEAVKWYRLSAEGNAKAMTNLGFCYYNGWVPYSSGMEQNKEEAYFWWFLASWNKEETAIENLKIVENELTEQQKRRIMTKAMGYFYEKMQTIYEAD